MRSFRPSGAGFYPAPHSLPLASLFLASLALVLFSFSELALSLSYDRSAIAIGEVWRLFAGHWTHWSLEHLVWDLSAFLVLAVCLERRSPRLFVATCLISALGLSLGLYFHLPSLVQYRGLSGIDSALFAALVVDLFWDALREKDWPRAWLLLGVCAGFAAKLAWEFATGSAFFVRATSIATIPEAPLIGASFGALIAVIRLLDNPLQLSPRPALIGAMRFSQ